MKDLLSMMLVMAALGLFPMPAAAGERKAAEVKCAPTDQKLVYDCVITLKAKKSGAPIADAEFTVGADMPSMPGAHNVRPVPAEAHGMAGIYRARIEIEMTGEWALKLDFTKPSRDRLIKKLHFGGMAGQEAPRSGMSHGAHKGKRK
ncbi:MAG: FixH family protein [Deltaproteobacteria bacterium]|nr:FixH family protein [Deltaproteobacteria bacterium]